MIDTSASCPAILLGKTIEYWGNKYIPVTFKYNWKEEERRIRILKANGVIPKSPKTDGG